MGGRHGLRLDKSFRSHGDSRSAVVLCCPTNESVVSLFVSIFERTRDPTLRNGRPTFMECGKLAQAAQEVMRLPALASGFRLSCSKIWRCLQGLNDVCTCVTF